MHFYNRFDFNRYSHQWGFIALMLSCYCIGHGILTEQVLLPLLSIAWSFSHATGLILLLLSAKQFRNRLGPYAIVPTIIGALVLSDLLFRLITWGIAESYSLHNYTSVVIYSMAGILCYLYFPRTNMQSSELWVTVGRKSVLLSPENIEFVTAAKNYIEIVSPQLEGSGLIRSSLDDFANANPILLKVHRSTLINPNAIDSIQKLPRSCLNLVMKSGAQIKVSASYRQTVLAIQISTKE